MPRQFLEPTGASKNFSASCVASRHPGQISLEYRKSILESVLMMNQRRRLRVERSKRSRTFRRPPKQLANKILEVGELVSVISPAKEQCLRHEGKLSMRTFTREDVESKYVAEESLFPCTYKMLLKQTDIY